jgi:hypothetical protein
MGNEAPPTKEQNHLVYKIIKEHQLEKYRENAILPDVQFVFFFNTAMCQKLHITKCILLRQIYVILICIEGVNGGRKGYLFPSYSINQRISFHPYK